VIKMYYIEQLQKGLGEHYDNLWPYISDCVELIRRQPMSGSILLGDRGLYLNVIKFVTGKILVSILYKGKKYSFEFEPKDFGS